MKKRKSRMKKKEIILFWWKFSGFLCGGDGGFGRVSRIKIGNGF
jgi:hypothetical protein